MRYNRGYDHLNYRVGTLFEQIRKGQAYVRALASGDVTISARLGGAIRLLAGTVEIEGRLVYDPALVQAVGPLTTIIPISAVVELMATAPAIMLSTPTIESGLEGQEILVMNTGTQTIMLSDESGLTGSGLRLEDEMLPLTPLSSVRLRYLAVLSVWVQIAPATNIL